jgi:YD repeat-containing protein
LGSAGGKVGGAILHLPTNEAFPMQMFNKLLVAFLSFALSLVPLYSYALGAAFEQSGDPGFFSSPSSSSSKESPTSRMVRDASGRLVAVGAAALSHDAAGRVTHIDAPGHHTKFHYDSEASIQPSAMTRDGVTYRITHGAHSVRLVPMQKLITDQPTEEDLIAQAMDFMGTCAAEPECMGGGGPDIDL